MGRPKGSKNKSTLAKLGLPISVGVPKPTTPITVVAANTQSLPPPVVRVPVPLDVTPAAELAYREALKEVAEMVIHFRAEAYILPDRLRNKLIDIKAAKNSEDIELLKKKALNSIHLNYCYEWSKEKIPGPALRHLSRPKGDSWGVT
jgi:hypothetical protein